MNPMLRETLRTNPRLLPALLLVLLAPVSGFNRRYGLAGHRCRAAGGRFDAAKVREDVSLKMATDARNQTLFWPECLQWAFTGKRLNVFCTWINWRLLEPWPACVRNGAQGHVPRCRANWRRHSCCPCGSGRVGLRAEKRRQGVPKIKTLGSVPAKSDVQAYLRNHLSCQI